MADTVTDAVSTPPPAPDAALRGDIKALGELLGQTLVRQEGRALFDLVEQIRALTRSPEPGAADEAQARLAEIDLGTAIRLVRAFSNYFYLANVTEQVHRARELHGERATSGSWLSRAVDRIGAAIEDPESKVTKDWVEEVVGRLSARPVFTAHPTEAARRTILGKLRQIALLLDSNPFPQPGTVTDPVARRRAERRLEELVESLWQTDELRVSPPGADRRGAQRPLLPRRAARQRGARRARRAGRRARADRRAAAGGRAPAELRQLDRRRPGRQPERHRRC